METPMRRANTPSFKGFLYWYIAIQCAAFTAIVTVSFAYGFLMAFFGVLPHTR
jgi:hypothetical protein